MFKSVLFATLSALAVGEAAQSHLAIGGLVQIPPSYAHDGIYMYPGHHPDHDPQDLAHLTPTDSNTLYYCQEGHRPAVHGAKHGTFEAVFNRPTVVLDHSSHLTGIQCKDGNITMYFSQVAFDHAQAAWTYSEFNLVTYHVGCGDEYSGQRSYFLASAPQFYAPTRRVIVTAVLIESEKALDNAVVSWGTYQNPRKRDVAVMGHVRVEQTSGADSDGWNAVCNFAKKTFNTLKDLVFGVGKAIKELVILAKDLALVPFGVPFERTYHNDIVLGKEVPKKSGVSSAGNKQVGYLTNFKVKSPEDKDKGNDASTTYSITCTKCGIKADFTIDGSLAFSIEKGLTSGNIALKNNEDFTIDAIFALAVEAEKKLLDYKKQLVAFPLSPLTIPGIVTLGPQVAIKAAVAFTVKAKAELTIGGTLKISPGVAVLDVMDLGKEKEDRRSGIDGLESSFTPVFTFSGSVEATLEAGLPIAIELGLDVLNGKFKLTVGLEDKPSIYGSAKATVSSDEKTKCNGGVEIRVGAKNKLSFKAIATSLTEYTYDFRTDTIYDKGLLCVTAEGFDVDNVNPDKSDIFDTTPKTLGVDINDVKTPLNNVAGNLTQANTNAGYRVIMESEREFIVLSGKDGFIYLAKPDATTDVSAPWGSSDIKSGSLVFDVFGRALSHGEVKDGVVSITVQDTAKVPSSDRAATPEEQHRPIIFPTFCKTPTGRRLFGTEILFGKGGKFKAFEHEGKGGSESDLDDKTNEGQVQEGDGYVSSS
ncbi:hypothetical protein GQ53DRAFT_773647 [Thozetella sp. PMI_491]|nr:hypothetical protein GQ53DRAFT_773647 [Thozetella sp. PMI_491]